MVKYYKASCGEGTVEYVSAAKLLKNGDFLNVVCGMIVPTAKLPTPGLSAKPGTFRKMLKNLNGQIKK